MINDYKTTKKKVCNVDVLYNKFSKSLSKSVINTVGFEEVYEPPHQNIWDIVLRHSLDFYRK